MGEWCGAEKRMDIVSGLSNSWVADPSESNLVLSMKNSDSLSNVWGKNLEKRKHDPKWPWLSVGFS